MDTSYFFPDIQRQQLLADQGTLAQQQIQEQPLNYQLLRQQVMQGQLTLAGQQQSLAMRGAALAGYNNWLNGGNQQVPQPSAPPPNAPQQNPSATGGGGSAGGVGGSNPSGEAMTSRPSPTSTVNGAAPSSQGAPGMGGGPGSFGGGLGEPDYFQIRSMPPELRSFMAVAFPELAKSLDEAQQSEVKTAQLKAQGPISFLETVRNSQSPSAILKASPTLLAQWAQVAPSFGIDPRDPNQITDDNVRQVMGALANNLRGQVGLQPTNYEHWTLLPPGPAGERFERNDATGQTRQIQGESLKQVAGPNGPVYVSADQAAGKTPFNASIFGAANVTEQALGAAYDNWVANGRPNSPPGGFGRNPQLASRFWDFAAQRDRDTGNTVGASKAYAAANKADGAALEQQTKLLSNVTSYGSTLDKNIALLKDAMTQRDATGSPLINTVITAWQQGVTGDPATARYVAALTAVQTEVAKIQSGSLGNTPISDALRKEINSMANKNMSAAGLSGALDIFVQEGANRRGSIQDEIDTLKGQIANRQVPGSSANQSQGSQGVSNVTRTAAGLTPQGANAPGSASTSANGGNLPLTNAQGWTLHTDKNGVRAYVSPDGKQYQTVK